MADIDYKEELTIPTAEQVVQAEQEYAQLQRILAQIQLNEDMGISKHVIDGKEYTFNQVLRDINQWQLEKGGMHEQFVRQDREHLFEDFLPEERTYTILKNRMNELKRENELIEAGWKMGNKVDYTQHDKNATDIKQLKRDVGRAEIAMYDRQKEVQEKEGTVEISQQTAGKYKITAVLGGQVFNGEMNTQQHDKMLALGDKQRMVFLQQLLPKMPMKDMTQQERNVMLTSLNDSMVPKQSAAKPEIYASVMESKQTTVTESASQTNKGAMMAAANFDTISSSQQTGQENTRQVGMGR